MKSAAILALAFAAATGQSGAAAQYLWQARDAARAGTAAPNASAVQPHQGTGSGLQIFIDPDTGLIRPAEQEDFRALMPPRLAPEAIPAPQPFAARDGAIGLRLDPSFDSYMLAVRRPDGTLAFDCVEGRTQPAPTRPINATGAGTSTRKAPLDEM